MEDLRQLHQAMIDGSANDSYYDYLINEFGHDGAERMVDYARNWNGYQDDLRFLKEYMRNPWSATAHVGNRSTLEGLAQETSVLQRR
jgi:hypothetical protein